MELNTVHSCRRCGFVTKSKMLLIKHFDRKQVCDPTIEDIPIKQLQLETRTHNINVWKDPVSNIKYYMCAKCGKGYKHPSSKYRHEDSCDKGPETVFTKPTQFIDSTDLEIAKKESYDKAREELDKRTNEALALEIDELKKKVKEQELAAAMRKRRNDRQSMLRAALAAPGQPIVTEPLPRPPVVLEPISADLVLSSYDNPYIDPDALVQMFRQFCRRDDDPSEMFMKEWVYTIYCAERRNNSIIYSHVCDRGIVIINGNAVEMTGSYLLGMIIGICKTTFLNLYSEGRFNLNASIGWMLDQVHNAIIRGPVRHIAAVLHDSTHNETEGHLRQMWMNRFPEEYRKLLDLEAEYQQTHQTPARVIDR